MNSATIDAVCEYWDEQPCNVRHSAHPVGTKDYFEEVLTRKYTVEPHILKFARFDDWRGASVLEIGCGIGTDAVGFARAGAIYTGVELSPKSLFLAKRRFELLGLNGNFVLGNAEKLSEFLRPHLFDLVYSFGVIHHTPNPRAVVDEVWNYMHDESHFQLMLYARQSWKRIMIDAGLDQPEAKSGCPIAMTYTRLGAKQLLSDYQIVSMEQAHIFPYVVEDYIQYRYTIQPWFKAMPEKMFHALEKSLGWHLLITAKKNSQKQKPSVMSDYEVQSRL